MSDDFRPYFSRIDNEKSPRLEVLEKRTALRYEQVIQLNVQQLASCEVSVFGRVLVVSPYGEGYRATWCPNCIEVERTFAPNEPAGILLQHAYAYALRERGFEVSSPVGGISSTRNSSSQLRNPPQE